MTSTILKGEDGRISPDDNSAWTTLNWRRKLETLGPMGVQVTAKGAEGKTEGLCISGELTDRGRETTLALGQHLRRLYVDQLGFMPSEISNASLIYLRSTHMPRAMESLQQAFTGMYPLELRDKSFQPTITMRRWQDDQLFPNTYGCKRFDILHKAFSKIACKTWDESPEMEYINSKIQKYMPDKRPVAVQSHPALIGILDTNNARLAHGPSVALPKEFDDKALRINMEKIAVDEWFAGYSKNREYRMVGIGGLVGDILENIGKYIENKNGAEWKFSLNGCHDTTLAGIMSSFGIFQHEPWPPFTSHIAVETFQSKDRPSASASGVLSRLFSTTPAPISRTPFDELSTKQKHRLQGYYVRIRYNNRAYTIPGCKAPGKHFDGDESFCTLVCSGIYFPLWRRCGQVVTMANANLSLQAAFKEIADKFVPRDWRGACEVNLDKGVLEEENVEAGH